MYSLSAVFWWWSALLSVARSVLSRAVSPLDRWCCSVWLWEGVGVVPLDVPVLLRSLIFLSFCDSLPEGGSSALEVGAGATLTALFWPPVGCCWLWFFRRGGEDELILARVGKDEESMEGAEKGIRGGRVGMGPGKLEAAWAAGAALGVAGATLVEEGAADGIFEVAEASETWLAVFNGCEGISVELGPTFGMIFEGIDAFETIEATVATLGAFFVGSLSSMLDCTRLEAGEGTGSIFGETETASLFAGTTGLGVVETLSFCSSTTATTAGCCTPLGGFVSPRGQNSWAGNCKGFESVFWKVQVSGTCCCCCCCNGAVERVGFWGCVVADDDVPLLLWPEASLLGAIFAAALACTWVLCVDEAKFSATTFVTPGGVTGELTATAAAVVDGGDDVEADVDNADNVDDVKLVSESSLAAFATLAANSAANSGFCNNHHIFVKDEWYAHVWPTFQPFNN